MFWAKEDQTFVKEYELQFINYLTDNTLGSDEQVVPMLDRMFNKARSEDALDQIWNARGDDGSSPLHLGAKLGNACLVEWILDTWEKHG